MNHIGDTRRWNRTAKECYARGCVCSGCEIYERYFRPQEKRCGMKDAVLELVRKFKKPRGIDLKQIIEE